jgi:photosystem II stability/assembly factor-like uncharacterized protein
MSEDDVRDLIHSVVERGSTLGVTITAAEIRTKFSRTGGTGAPKAAAAPPLRRRVAVLLVAALILAVFFVPFPHLGLLNQFVTPAGRSTTVTSVTAPRTTSRNVPPADLTLATVWTVGASAAWVEWDQNTPGNAQGLVRSTDGGKHWTDVTPPGSGAAVGAGFIGDLFALDAEHAWVTYQATSSGVAQEIATTSNGGRHWTVVGRSPGPGDCSVQFVTTSDGWCVGIGGAAGSEAVVLYRTEDGGRHWRMVSDGTPGRTTRGALPFACDKNVQFLSANIGWAVFWCNGGATPLYETTDGGTTWIRRSVAETKVAGGSGFTGVPVLTGAAGAVGFTLPAAHGLTRSVVYVSSDSGRSWHPVTPPGPPAPWFVDTLTARRWRLVNGNQVLATDNAGRTWHTIRSNVSFDLPFGYTTPPAAHFESSQVGWIVGSPNASRDLLWRTSDGGRTWRQIPVPGLRSTH